MLCIKNEKGSALVEVMVALVVLSIGLIGVSRMSYTIIKGNVRGSHVSKALNLLQAQVEFFQGQADISNTLADTYTPDVPIPVNAEGVTGQSDSVYRRDWMVSGTADMKTITIRVRWSDGELSQQVSLATMVRL